METNSEDLCPGTPEEMEPRHYDSIARWAARGSPQFLQEEVRAEVTLSLLEKIVPNFDPGKSQAENSFPMYVLFRARKAALNALRAWGGRGGRKAKNTISISDATTRNSYEGEDYEVLPASLTEVVTPESFLLAKQSLNPIKKASRAYSEKRGTSSRLLNNLPDGVSNPHTCGALRGPRQEADGKLTLSQRRGNIPDPGRSHFPWG